MFSGKTDELLRRVRREIIAGRKVQVFCSHRNTHLYKTSIRSRSGHKTKALIVPKSSPTNLRKMLAPDTQVIAIDEVQFFPPEIVPVLEHMANSGIKVIAAGLDLDFRGQPFRGPDGAMAQLLAKAERIDKLSAVCMICGADATRTQRLVSGKPAQWTEPFHLKTGRDEFIAVCRRHHQIEEPTPQERQLEYQVFEDN